MAVVISDRLLEGSDRLLDAEPDDRLVSLIQAGHEAAFAAVVRRYERELKAQAHRLSSDGRGEDAVQQAFLNAFAALRSGSEVRHLRGWLHQILRNEVTRARVPIDAPLEATVAYGETLEDTVTRRATAHAALRELSALPDRQRDALLGTAVLGFPRAQVARTMGLSEGAVRQLVHRARLRLRQVANGLIPFPLFKLFGAAGSGIDANPDAALGPGAAVSAAASGGLAVKVGTLLASGILATGIAVTHVATSHHRHGAARTGHRAGSHAARQVAAASAGPALVSDRLPERSLGTVGAGETEHAGGGPGPLSQGRPGRHHGAGSGHGRSGSQGRDGTPATHGDGGSGHSPGGTSGRNGGDGSSGSAPTPGSSSGPGSGSGSRSGSGSGSDGPGRGESGSGSSSGRQGASGSGPAPVSATATSGSDSGAASSDGGSGRSSGGGGGTSSSDDDTSGSAPSGSSGSTASGSGTAAQTSGSSGGSQGGADQANVANLGSDGAQTADSGSSSGSGKENSHVSRDLSGATHSSSS